MNLYEIAKINKMKKIILILASLGFITTMYSQGNLYLRNATNVNVAFGAKKADITCTPITNSIASITLAPGQSWTSLPYTAYSTNPAVIGNYNMLVSVAVTGCPIFQNVFCFTPPYTKTNIILPSCGGRILSVTPLTPPYSVLVGVR
jgi:hypothetical protein